MLPSTAGHEHVIVKINFQFGRRFVMREIYYFVQVV